MQEMSEAEIISESLIKAFIQFKKLRMNESSMNQESKHSCHDLKHSEMMILYELKEVQKQYPEGISVSSISQLLCVKPPTITPVITSLEQKGMIERSMDSNDRRIIRVKMTEAGNQFIEDKKQQMVTKIKGLVEHLGEEKSTILADLFNEVFFYFINQEQINKNTKEE